MAKPDEGGVISQQLLHEAMQHAVHLLQLPLDRRQALMRALAASAPVDADFVEDTTVAEIAAAAAVSSDDVVVALKLLYNHFLDASSEELLEFRTALRTALSVEATDEKLDTLLTSVSAVADDLNRQRAIERFMPAFRMCDVAWDLRLVSLKPGARTAVPIAIVRVLLDEGRDAIFQCTPNALRSFAAALNRALAEMDDVKSAVEKLR